MVKSESGDDTRLMEWMEEDGEREEERRKRRREKRVLAG